MPREACRDRDVDRGDRDRDGSHRSRDRDRPRKETDRDWSRLPPVEKGRPRVDGVERGRDRDKDKVREKERERELERERQRERRQRVMEEADRQRSGAKGPDTDNVDKNRSLEADLRARLLSRGAGGAASSSGAEAQGPGEDMEAGEMVNEGRRGAGDGWSGDSSKLSKLSNSPAKRRKFTPIIWDLDRPRDRDSRERPPPPPPPSNRSLPPPPPPSVPPPSTTSGPPEPFSATGPAGSSSSFQAPPAAGQLAQPTLPPPPPPRTAPPSKRGREREEGEESSAASEPSSPSELSSSPMSSEPGRESEGEEREQGGTRRLGGGGGGRQPRVSTDSEEVLEPGQIRESPEYVVDEEKKDEGEDNDMEEADLEEPINLKRTSRWAEDEAASPPPGPSRSLAAGTPDGGEAGGEGGKRPKQEDGEVGGSRDELGDEYDRELNRKELEDLAKESDGRGGEDDLDDLDSLSDEEGLGLPPTPGNRAIDMLQGCRSVDDFERLNRIDEGTYGVVFRARDKRSGEVVALKQVKMDREREGFPMTSLREINILLSLHHPSIVNVKEVVVGSSLNAIYMVMEYMEHDIKSLMEVMKHPFSPSEVKCLMLQLLEGIRYLHDNWVLHRDLKTSNLLLNNKGELKICDFGLARQYGSPLRPYTHMVVTLWYRAPELLLGAKSYSTAIDMWSAGCIMAEFLSKEALLNGTTELAQVDKIFKLLGTPTEQDWPEYTSFPSVSKVNFVKQPHNLLRERFPTMSVGGKPTLSEKGMDLLKRFLTYDPKKRITAEEALQHEWFSEVPLPKDKKLMPFFMPRNEHDRRARRTHKSPDPILGMRDAEVGAGGLFG